MCNTDSVYLSAVDIDDVGKDTSGGAPLMFDKDDGFLNPFYKPFMIDQLNQSFASWKKDGYENHMSHYYTLPEKKIVD